MQARCWPEWGYRWRAQYRTTVSRLHYTAKERDLESGLDYFGARYFSSTMGRFLSPDWSKNPQGVPYANYANPQSLNLYAFVGNNKPPCLSARTHSSIVGRGWLRMAMARTGRQDSR